MDFKNYLFPCKEVNTLVSRKKAGYLPSETQVQKALNALSRDNLLAMPATDIENILVVIQKYAEQTPKGLSGTLSSYLTDIYLNQCLDVNRLPAYEDESAREYQLNGSRNEKVAIEIISRVDNAEYVKNKTSFENDYFRGIPDVLTGHSVFEIKTRHLYASFIKYLFQKPSRSDFYQLQCEMDVAGVDEGELIYVATGINQSDRSKYLENCRSAMEARGMNDKKIENTIVSIEKSCNLDWMPDNKRIIRFPVKKNPAFIKFAKTKVTAARNWLAKFHDKFEKM